MTREEALDILTHNWTRLENPNYEESELDKAYYMAIEALSAEAVQIPIKLEKRYPESKDEDITDAFVRGYLAGRSSAEAVQGEWVRKYDDEINCYWYECDQCGEYRPRNIFGHEYDSNFCPNCGARMKGGAE